VNFGLGLGLTGNSLLWVLIVYRIVDEQMKGIFDGRSTGKSWPCRWPAERRSLDEGGASAGERQRVARNAQGGERGMSRLQTETSPRRGPGRTAFLFDLDGTLVDSVYQHVLAWGEAMAAVGIEVAVWTIHRRIGMSGGLMANAILRETGHSVSTEEAGRLLRLHAEAYARLAARSVRCQARESCWRA
jgi:hypothetical protein